MDGGTANIRDPVFLGLKRHTPKSMWYDWRASRMLFPKFRSKHRAALDSVVSRNLG